MGGNREGIMNLDLGRVRPRKKRLWVKALGLGTRAGWFSLKVTVALALPFFLLVRGSVYAYQDLGWGTWSSLASGVFATALLFLIYASMLWKRMTGKRRVPRLASRLLFAVVGGYLVYGLLYLSAANAKTPELSEYYTSLHPLMRIGASTFLLFDREAVVTDLGRTVEDYLEMGLPVNETSLHTSLQAGGSLRARSGSAYHRPDRAQKPTDRRVLPDHGVSYTAAYGHRRPPACIAADGGALSGGCESDREPPADRVIPPDQA